MMPNSGEQSGHTSSVGSQREAATVGRRLFADAGGIGGATRCGRGI